MSLLLRGACCGQPLNLLSASGCVERTHNIELIELSGYEVSVAMVRMSLYAIARAVGIESQERRAARMF